MKENKTKPDIRFKGFTEAWEQRKLGTLCSLITKGTTPKDKSGNGEVNFIKVENIDIDNGEITSTSKISIAEHEGYLKRSKLKENDILFSIAGTLGRVSVVKSSILPANTNQALAILRINEGYIPYLTTVLKGQAVEDFIRRNPTIGAQPNLSLEQVNNLDISYPNYDEQVRIGQYFSNLDHLITLHQRECDQLKELKKSMLKKMFPRDESSIPEVRFAGFTDAWEQRKVSKITKFHKQGFYTIEDYNDNKKYYLLRGTDFSENKLLLKDTPKINATKKDYEAFKTELGDFLIVRSGTVGTYGIVDVDIPAIFGSYLIDFRFDMEQVTNEFFGYFYQSDLFKSQLNKIIQTSANTNINAENIKSTVISLPNLDEQRKISEYLGNLDHLITLHQRELEILKNLKKTCLKRMFI